MKPAAARERNQSEPPLPPSTAAAAIARPSSVSTTDESDSISGDSLEGTVDLIVNLPDKRVVTASVEKRMQMMDLLVHIATANKFSPGNHILKIVNDLDNTFVAYKPSTPIGSLNTSLIFVEPKKNSENSSKTSRASTTQPFEKTFRLQVHLPKQQLLVLRVSPQIKLSILHQKICDSKGLEPSRYKLQHPQNEHLVLDLALTLEDYHLTEINMVGSNSAENNFSTSNPSTAVVYKDSDKSKRTTFSFLRQKSRPHVDDNSSDNKSTRGVSPASTEASRSSSVASNRPVSYPAERAMKKRPAPLPPAANKTQQTRSERPPPPPPLRSKSTSSVKSCHSRHSSDSSGYHDSSVLGDSPELIEPESKLDSHSRNVSTSNASLVMPGMKKRRAPLPPGQRLFSKPCADEEKMESLDSNDNRTLKTEPSSQSPSPPPSKHKDGSASNQSPVQPKGLEKQLPDACDQNHNMLAVASQNKLVSSNSDDVSTSSGSLTNGNESESKTSSSSTIKEIEGSQEHLSEVDTQQMHALNGPLPPSPNTANTNDSSHASQLPSKSHQVPLKHVPSSSLSSTLGTQNQTACGSVASSADSCARTGENMTDVAENSASDTGSVRSHGSSYVTEAEVHAAAEEKLLNGLQDALSDMDHVISDAEADVISFSSHSSTVVTDVDDNVDDDVHEQKGEVLEARMPDDQTDKKLNKNQVDKVSGDVHDVQHSNNKNTAPAAEMKSSEPVSQNFQTPAKRSTVIDSSTEDDEGLTFEEPDELKPIVVRPGNRKPLLNFSIATYKSRATSNGIKVTKVESFNGDSDSAEKREVSKVLPSRTLSFHEHSNLTATAETPLSKPTRNVILNVNPTLPRVAKKTAADDLHSVGSENSEKSDEDLHLSHESTKSVSMTNLDAINDTTKLRKSQSEFFVNEGNTGEDYLQLQQEYLKLQKKLFYWQQQLLNNQNLLQRQHILPSNAFQLSAEMLSMPPNFDLAENSSNDFTASKASTFPKQNARCGKDESLSKEHSSSNAQLSQTQNEVRKFYTWNEIPDENMESTRRDYRRNWKTPSVDADAHHGQNTAYFNLGKKNEPSKCQNPTHNGNVSNSKLNQGVKSLGVHDSEKSETTSIQHTIKYVERSAKDIKRNSNSPELIHEDSKPVQTANNKVSVTSSKSQTRTNEKVGANKQGLSFKDIPLRFSLGGYDAANRKDNVSDDVYAPNERKFRRQRVAPKEVDEDSLDRKLVGKSKPSFLFGETKNQSAEPRPDIINNKHGIASASAACNGNGTAVITKPSVIRTQQLFESADSTNFVGNVGKPPQANRNISVVKIESTSRTDQKVMHSNSKEMSSQPRIIKSKPKVKPKSCPVNEDPRDALLQAIKNFGGMQKLRKVPDSELL